MQLHAALFWLLVTLLLCFQTSALVQLLGFLEDLIEVKLSDDVLLEMVYISHKHVLVV